MKPRFVATDHCLSFVHCETCRTNAAWRRSLAERYELPGGEVDFACPHGLDTRLGRLKLWWRRHFGWKSRGLGDTVAKLTGAVGVKPCGGCRQSIAKLNKAVPYGRE